MTGPLRFDSNRPLQIAVLISGGGSTLANLIERIDGGQLTNVAIGLVISSRRSVRGVAIAREAGLPVKTIGKRDFTDEDRFSAALTEAVDEAGVDLTVLAGFLCFWRIPPHHQGRVLNIHPALLPRHGGRGMYGLHVHSAVLADGDAETGCTVHLVDNEYDHGPIIAQTRVPIHSGDTPESLAQRVMAAERESYPQVIQAIADQGLEYLAQFK